MRNRFVVYLLVAAAALTGLPAVAQQNAEEMTLTWWINPWRIRPPGFPAGETPTGEEFARYISEEFEKLHPNVNVEYEIVPNQGFGEKVATAIFAGNAPDVLKDLQWDPDWVRQGLLAPIDEYLTEEDREDFIDYTLEEGLIDGKHYIWPWNNSNNGMGSTLLLNPEIFEERGVEMPELPYREWTIEEFLDKAQQLTFDRDGDGTTDVYAITLAAQDTENMLAWLHRFGARLINEEGTEFVLNSPEGVEGLQLMVDMIYEYEIAPRGAEGLGVYDTINNLHQGRAAMGYGGIYEIGRIARYINSGELEEPIKVVIAPYPHDPEVGPVAYRTSGGFLVFQQDDPERQRMAMELARFITNKENIALLEDLLYITARKSVNDQLSFERTQAYTENIQQQVEVYENAISYGIPYYGPSSIDVSPALDFLTAALQAAFTRQLTPQEALDQFVEQANRVVFGN
ncbi:MAG TPA: sugar ABC transporter substrate-binding protein [Trueperaceae bacterium]